MILDFLFWKWAKIKRSMEARLETTERIVEAYVRYIKGCATIPNLRCAGQREIDILAINPVTLERFHIESSVSISKKFSTLNDKEFNAERLKDRVQKPAQRRTIGFFLQSKFSAPGVIETLGRYGFADGNYQKVIVTWDATPEAFETAATHGIAMWKFGNLMREIVKASRGTRHYFTDDTMRTLHLFDLMERDEY